MIILLFQILWGLCSWNYRSDLRTSSETSSFACLQSRTKRTLKACFSAWDIILFFWHSKLARPGGSPLSNAIKSIRFDVQCDVWNHEHLKCCKVVFIDEERISRETHLVTSAWSIQFNIWLDYLHALYIRLHFYEYDSLFLFLL